MPRGVQFAAAQLRDDLCFRAARVIERAVALPAARPEGHACGHH
jgi:aspartyl-tRNA(Asn)/glutamyl-tRNA(Gln) amidotransferase subunit A